MFPNYTAHCGTNKYPQKSINAMATFLGVSRSTVVNRLRTGKTITTKDGRIWRVEKNDDQTC